MKVPNWLDEATAPHEVRAARMFDAAARLEVPSPPEFSALASSPVAKMLAKRAVWKAAAVALVGVSLLLALWRSSTHPVEHEGPPVVGPALRETATEHPSVPAPALPPTEAPLLRPTPPIRHVATPRKPVSPVQSPAGGPEATPSTLGEEAKLLASVLKALRQDNDPARAVGLLREYHARFAAGVLRPEALLAQAQAERALHHPDAALAALSEMGSTSGHLAAELDVTRGELLSDLQLCEQAETAFGRVLASETSEVMTERAAWGRAQCAARRSSPQASPWLRNFLAEYPDSPHAAEAREALESLPAMK